MKLRLYIAILLMAWAIQPKALSAAPQKIQVAFYGDSLRFSIEHLESIQLDPQNIDKAAILNFYEQAQELRFRPLVNYLLYYKNKNQLDDWFYYQLIRKTAQELCPKQKNFELYTLYKWFLLAQSGYDARLAISDKRLLFYVRSEDNIYDIPYYKENDKQYVCLNYHDYGSKIDFTQVQFYQIDIDIPEAIRSFSYRVTRMPDFHREEYAEKDLQFNYENKHYSFKVMVNPELKNIFANYPVVDYEAYFNIPLSKKTYNSLIPVLQETVKGMSQKKGVEYLMRFVRDAFAYQNDQSLFGKEKRLSPEQTLLYQASDCDDRAAFFFALVKEIYNLPMIVLLYPEHVTIAVQFEKAKGKGIVYKDKKYLVCEPTPQAEDLNIGELATKWRNSQYEIAFEYNPN